MNFDLILWRQKCDSLAQECHAGSGLIYELYARQLSSSIDAALLGLPEQHRAEALEIARAEFDYHTPDEINDSIRNDLENGYCVHGIDPDCCPVGCGDHD